MFRTSLLLILLVPLSAFSADYWSLGLVDVTVGPFNADPMGQKDSTDALGRAMAYARSHRMVAFLPAGTYRVTDTLQAHEAPERATDDEVWNQGRDEVCRVGGVGRGPVDQ